jgi:hypothetical protein
MNKIQEILYILNLFLPYEISIKILYKYRGFITPSSNIIKPLINDCHTFIYFKRKIYGLNKPNYNIDSFDMISIRPKLWGIIKIIKNKNYLIYNYKNYFVGITCCLKISYYYKGIKLTSIKNEDIEHHYFNL